VIDEDHAARCVLCNKSRTFAGQIRAMVFLVAGATVRLKNRGAGRSLSGLRSRYERAATRAGCQCDWERALDAVSTLSKGAQ